MPYTPYNQPQSAFRGGKNILASEHFQYTEEGGTINASAVGARYVEVGEPFVRDMSDGLYVPFVDGTHTTEGALNTGFADPVICDVDFNSDGTNNIVVGQLIAIGSVYSGKLPDSVTDAFKALTTPSIRYVVRGV